MLSCMVQGRRISLPIQGSQNIKSEQQNALLLFFTVMKPVFSEDPLRTHGSPNKWDLVFSRLIPETNICIYCQSNYSCIVLTFLQSRRGGKKYFGLLMFVFSQRRQVENRNGTRQSEPCWNPETVPPIPSTSYGVQGSFGTWVEEKPPQGFCCLMIHCTIPEAFVRSSLFRLGLQSNANNA